MHFSGRGFVHVELIDPETAAARPFEDGAEGELVYTHLRHRAAPLLRFRSRDHVRVRAGACACGRTSAAGALHRADRRHADPARGQPLPDARCARWWRSFAPAVSGVVADPAAPARACKQAPPLPVAVELAEGRAADAGLAEAIARRLRERAGGERRRSSWCPGASLPRSDYKSKLVDWSRAAD